MAKQENVNVKININTSNATRTIADLRREFNEVSKAMQDAIVSGNKIKQQDLAAEYTRLSGEIKKVKSHLGALNPGALMEGFVNLASGAVGAISAITGAFMLFGDENERIQELEQKSMALIQTMMGLHEARTVLISAEAKASMKAMTQTIALRYKKISAQLTDTLSIQANTKASKLATAAQKLWNKAIAANPIVALVAAVAALTTGVVLLAKKMREVSEEEQRLNRIRKANIAVTNNANKSFANTEVKLRTYQKIVNDTTRSEEERLGALKEIEEETNGVVTATDLSAESLRKLNTDLTTYTTTAHLAAMAQAALELATEEYKKQLDATANAEQFKPGFWKRAWNAIEGSFNPNKIEGYVHTGKKNAQDMLDNQAEAVAEAGKNMQAYLDIAEENMKAVFELQEEAAKKAKERLEKEKEELEALREKEEAERKYIQWLKDKKAAIADLERAELQLQLSIATANKDYIKELEIRKKIEELNHKETLAKYEKQLKDKLITQEQFDSLVELLEKNHKNNLAAIDEEYADEKAAVQQRINEVIRSDMENEIAAVEEKYEELKKDAIKNGIEIKEIETELEAALQAELKEIRDRYAKEEEDDAAAHNEKMIDLERSRYRELWRLRIENAKTIKEWQDAAIEASKLEEEAALETARLAYESELELYKDNEEKKKEITASYEELKTEITQKAENERENIQKEATQRSLDNASALMGRMVEMTNALMDAELEAAGDNEEKKKEIRKKYAHKQAMMTVLQIGVDTAAAIMRALSDLGAIAGGIMSVAIGITGAAQAAQAKIQADQITRMRRGGLITGPSHEQGGVIRELEGGEAVINKNSMAIPGVPEMLSAINQAGGGVPITSSNLTTGSKSSVLTSTIDPSVIATIVDSLGEKIKSIPVVVAESDITETQRRVEVIESKTIFG